jgi:hypothetical protein
MLCNMRREMHVTRVTWRQNSYASPPTYPALWALHSYFYLHFILSHFIFLFYLSIIYAVLSWFLLHFWVGFYQCSALGRMELGSNKFRLVWLLYETNIQRLNMTLMGQHRVTLCGLVCCFCELQFHAPRFFFFRVLYGSKIGIRMNCALFLAWSDTGVPWGTSLLDYSLPTVEKNRSVRTRYQKKQ